MTEPRQFLIYQSEDGRTRIDVMLDAETLWLKQKRLPELFSKVKGTISEHVMHVFEGEVLKLGQLFGYSEQFKSGTGGPAGT